MSLPKIRISFLLLFLSSVLIDPASAACGVPSLSFSGVSLVPATLKSGTTGTLSVTLTETTGNDWARNVAVQATVFPALATVTPTSQTTLDRLDAGKSRTITYVVGTDLATPGPYQIKLSAVYSETGCFDIGVYTADTIPATWTLLFNVLPSSETGLCTNSKDDDQDGAVDCSDSDCRVDVACTGSIFVSTTPSGARITVDSVDKGSSPATISGLTFGSHVVEVKKDGYEDETIPISVSSNMPIQKQIPLRPKVGTLIITSSPISSAEVKVDGQTKGTTTLTIDLAPGSYGIAVSKTGYRTNTKQVSITANQRASVNFDLQQVTGSISINSEPSGAQVLVDGQLKGTTPTEVTGLPVQQEYTITLQKEGYKSYSTKETLTETKTTARVSAKLEESFSGVAVGFRATKTNIGLNEEAIVEFTATNRIGNPVLKLQLVPKVPSGFTISSTTGAKSGGGQFSNDFEVRPGDSRTITLRIKPEQTGTAELTGEWTYFFEGREQDRVTDKKAITFTVAETAASPVSVTQGGAGGTPAPQKSPGFEAALGLVALLATAVWLGRRK